MGNSTQTETARGADLATSMHHSINRYRIKRTLGLGGMATVMLAYDTELERDVALKIPKMQPTHKIEASEKRFLREAEVAFSITHPNLCQYYEIGVDEGSFFITMEYINGMTLKQILREAGPLNEQDASWLFSQLCSALHQLHQNEIVHRDLKPENIMLDGDGRPVIMDFGLAKFLRGGDPSMNISLTGQSIGTPMFMPPEQVRVEQLTPRSDVYSLGLTLWSVLCNQLPYEGDLLQITEQILFHESPSLRDHRADVSYEMEQICLKAISRDPEDRFSDMEAFQSALQTLC